jgi:Fe-S cluster assembly protein SufD
VKVQPIFSANETERALAAAYGAAAGRLPGAGDERLAALRQRSIARFEATGLPHRRLETWKYTDLRGILRELPEEGAAPSGLPDLAEVPLARAFAALTPHWLVFVDGRFRPELSGGAAPGAGVTVRALSDGAVPDWALAELTRTDAGEIDAVFDLNTALMADGALIHVGEGVDAGAPIAILHLGESAGTRHLRHVVVVEEGATLALAEAYGGPGAGLVTASALWRIGDGATVDHVKVQEIAAGATHLAPQLGAVGAHARFSTFTLSLGAGLTREERRVGCAGEASTVSVSGAYFLDGKAHGDTTLVVTHTAPGCTSRERFKGLVGGAARGVFQGAVIVERGAGKTDARQSVDALLLSDDARHDAKPELEIYADDVQCGHGATTGELDRNALFYLRARGIAKPEAERLLIAAFLDDGLEAVEHDGFRAALGALAAARLAARDRGASDA